MFTVLRGKHIYVPILLMVLLDLVLAGRAKERDNFTDIAISCIIVLVEVSGISGIFKCTA